MRLEIAHPKINDLKFGTMLSRENMRSFGGEYTNEELQIVEEIALVAKSELKKECIKYNKTGFILSVAFSSKTPIMIQLGEIKKADDDYGDDGKKLKYLDFARSKIVVLQSNTLFTRSSENVNLSNKFLTVIKHKDVPAGGVAFDNGYIISISGLSDDPFKDEKASLKIGKVLGFKEATSSNF